jgi:hypothetical protein
MPRTLLFSTIKNAGLYLVPIKNYSKKYPHFLCTFSAYRDYKMAKYHRSWGRQMKSVSRLFAAHQKFKQTEPVGRADKTAQNCSDLYRRSAFSLNSVERSLRCSLN